MGQSFLSAIIPAVVVGQSCPHSHCPCSCGRWVGPTPVSIVTTVGGSPITVVVPMVVVGGSVLPLLPSSPWFWSVVGQSVLPLLPLSPQLAGLPSLPSFPQLWYVGWSCTHNCHPHGCRSVLPSLLLSPQLWLVLPLQLSLLWLW